MLRPYQQEAFEAIQKDLHVPGNSIVRMPTASGKSHAIAHTATLVEHVLILQPTQELLAQNMEKLSAIVGQDEIGIYSASFNKKEIKKFTFATIQSVYKKADEFKHIKLVVVDECHMISIRSASSMYMDFFNAIGNPKVIGTTATPFRLELGYNFKTADALQITMLKLINRARHKDAKEMFWKRIIFDVSHKYLLEHGYLSPLEYIDKPLLPYESIPVNISRSDYNLEGFANAIVGQQANILSTIAEAQNRYTAVLVFCSTVEQAEGLSKIIVGSKTVFGNTPTKERKQIIADFKSGKVKTVFNVGALVAGFDFPELDCVILLRPTRSLVLYNQIVGRLVRIAPGKSCGTLIDFTGTYKALGRIETFELYRNERGLWDLRTEKHDSWHDRILFSRPL